MSNVPNQMINYFNTQSDLNNFSFQFDPSPGRWVPKPEHLNAALRAKKQLFKIGQTDWEKYRMLFNFDINDIPVGEVETLIDHITSVHFNKIINP
jgi:hypothetical protein